LTLRRLLFGASDDFQALVFSDDNREPSFYQGLFGPLLCLALQGGIAYTWGLQAIDLGPTDKMILTPENSLSPDCLPITTFISGIRSNLKTCYCFFNFLPSYSSPERHRASVTDAI
jgi:hypothetical protein